MIKIPFVYSRPDYTDFTTEENLEKITTKQVPVKLGNEVVGHLEYVDFGDFYDKRNSMCGAIVFQENLIGGLLYVLAGNDMFRLLAVGQSNNGKFDYFTLEYICLISSKQI